jgi:hypothetical protein
MTFLNMRLFSRSFTKDIYALWLRAANRAVQGASIREGMLAMVVADCSGCRKALGSF